MDAAVSQTKDIDQRLKELEKVEAEVLTRLHNTQQLAACEF